MKPFICQQCRAILSYTDGLHLYFPIQYVNPLGRPTLNYVQVGASPMNLTCGCGSVRKWYRQEIQPETEYPVRVNLLLPLS